MQSTRFLTRGALLAALFAVTAYAFKGFVLVPGITEIRLVDAYIVIYGLLFGSLGAWACAIGNLIGDLLGGTLTLGSVGGFIGNYASAYVPYVLWTRFRQCEGERFFVPRTFGDVVFWILLCLASAIPSAVIIATWTDLIGMVSFNILFVIIMINSTVALLIVGTLLYFVLIRTKLDFLHDVALTDDTAAHRRWSGWALAATLTASLFLAIFFVAMFSPAPGQTGILLPMAVCSTAMVVFMKL